MLGLCIMHPKYDNLSLIVCVSRESFPLICFHNSFFVLFSWLPVMFSNIKFKSINTVFCPAFFESPAVTSVECHREKSLPMRFSSLWK